MTGQVDERRRSRQVDGRPEGDPGGVDALAGLGARVERAEQRAADDAALKRARFRARWIETGAPTSSPDEAELTVKIGVLFERIGEIVGDLEDGVAPERAGVTLAEALGALDVLDERLGDIERWVRDVAARQGVTLPAPGEAVAGG